MDLAEIQKQAKQAVSEIVEASGSRPASFSWLAALQARS